jgi:DNA-binding response OmpR family regulator
LSTAIERKKILIIDDETDMRIFLCNLLGTCGFEPIDAEDRVQGLQKAKAEKPDLIILDVMMAGEAGIQMYRDLKSDEALKTVPVIMVSAIDKKIFLHYQKVQALPQAPEIPDPGAYLEKPLEAEELMQLVHRLTEKDACSPA